MSSALTFLWLDLEQAYDMFHMFLWDRLEYKTYYSLTLWEVDDHIIYLTLGSASDDKKNEQQTTEQNVLLCTTFVVLGFMGFII